MKIGFLLLFSFTTLSVSGDKIHWRKMDTEEKLRSEFDKRFFPGDDIAHDYEILKNEKHELLEQQGDTLLLFDSPFISTAPFSFVSRKWMCRFHYAEKKLLNYSVEKGLLGP